MSTQVTVYGAEGCWKCANTARALELAGIAHQVVDIDTAGIRDELRQRGIRELPYVDVDGRDSWTGLRLDLIVELRLLTLADLDVSSAVSRHVAEL